MILFARSIANPVEPLGVNGCVVWSRSTALYGADRVLFGTDYGPVPLDPREHVDIVNTLGISPADKEKILAERGGVF